MLAKYYKLYVVFCCGLMYVLAIDCIIHWVSIHSSTDVSDIVCRLLHVAAFDRDVQNPMKISDIGIRFSKNRTEPTSKFKNRKLGFHGSVFKKLTSAVWGQFFTLSHSQLILQHDRINGQCIFRHAISLHL